MSTPGPPPLRPTGLLLRRDGTFEHEGIRVSHPKLHDVLLRGVRFLEEEGVWIVQVGRFRGQIEVEEIPFWVVAYDPRAGAIQLTDGTEEPLRAETLTVDADHVLRCTVKGRFPARFTQTGQAHLLDALEARGDRWVLRLGDRLATVPGLPGVA
jgi:hypothetical protein